MSHQTASSVSVVVVSYNTCEALGRCLASIEPEHQVIVVDNASEDGSADRVARDFPHVALIRNACNVGFGAANNAGAKLVERELTLFLNSDCVCDPGAIGLVASAFKDSAVVAAGGKLVHPDSALQRSCAKELTLLAVASEQFGLESALHAYWHNDLPATGSAIVDQVMGACLMIRSGSIAFDESFFLYCEDTELLHRLKRKTGGRVVYVADARFAHELGASSRGRERWLSVARYNRGKELYFYLHHGRLPAWTCLALNRFGALLRLAAWSAVNIVTLFSRESLRERIPLWGAVLTAPLSGPPRPDCTEP